MNLFTIHRIALKALAQNKLRTGLTMLGIVIGVAAVICVVAIGEGASIRVEQAITNIGANMIWIEAGGVNRAGVRTGAYGTRSLTLGDFQAIQDHVPLATNVYIGLAVVSHDTSTLTTATFDNVALNGTAPPPPGAPVATATSPSGKGAAHGVRPAPAPGGAPRAP